MFKLLSIGNGLSEDATAFLYDIAKFDNRECKIASITIDDCSLETHWKNVLSDNKAYTYHVNGKTEDEKKGLYEILTEDTWDAVIFQQSLKLGGLDISYYPYIKSLSTYVKKYAPSATQYILQPWAYEAGYKSDDFAPYDKDPAKMQRQIYMTIFGAARNIRARIVPCGEIFEKIRKLPSFSYEDGGQSLCRDGANAHYIYGRYALAATLYEAIMAGNILENKFYPSYQDKSSKHELIQIIKDVVHYTITK